MISIARRRMFLSALALIGCFPGPTRVSAASEVPETVIITYQVKAGAEAGLSRVIAEHWRVARRMNLVHSSPHIVLQGGDEGKRYIVEVLTWRDGSIPDNAPEAITRLWRQMSLYVEPLDGRQGIDFSHVNILAQ